MGFPYLDYFNCEPFELNFRLYVFGGFWPLETDVKWKKVLFSVFSFLCYFSLTSMIVIQVIDIYLLRNDPVGLTKDLSSISIAYTIVIKSILILYKVNVVNYLKNKFTEYKNSRTDPSDVEILENSNAQILIIIKTFYVFSLPCVVFWMLYPGLDSPRKGVPFPYRLPVEEWTFPVYVGLYVYQSFSMVGYMINTLAVDAMFCGFVLRINAHYDIVIKNVVELGRLDEKSLAEGWDKEAEAKMARKILRENIELHKKILRELKGDLQFPLFVYFVLLSGVTVTLYCREIKIFEEIYSPPCFVHFAGIITIIGTAIIDFVRIVKEIKFQLLQKLLFVSIAIWDSFLYCFYATKMQQKSLELSRAAYGAHWYNMQPEIRKDLMFLLFKAQKEPKVKVAHLFDLNLRAFVKLMKMSYDITALLFQTVKE